MIDIRPMDISSDYPTVARWWSARGLALPPPACFLSALGFVATYEGMPVAASWLYVVPGSQGGIGIIEFTTTNPDFRPMKTVLRAVRMLYQHLEARAWQEGCGSVLSFVGDNTGEERIMTRMGWTDCSGTPHKTFGKARPCP